MNGSTADNGNFPQKLYMLLEKESKGETHSDDISLSDSFRQPLESSSSSSHGNNNGCIVAWLQHGKAFRIYDKEKFSNITIPKYFKHTKVASFQRQLNLYGFRRVSKGEDQGSYFHPKFSRSRRDLLNEIKRVPTSKLKSGGHNSVDDDGNDNDENPDDKVISVDSFITNDLLIDTWTLATAIPIFKSSGSTKRAVAPASTTTSNLPSSEAASVGNPFNEYKQHSSQLDFAGNIASFKAPILSTQSHNLRSIDSSTTEECVTRSASPPLSSSASIELSTDLYDTSPSIKSAINVPSNYVVNSITNFFNMDNFANITDKFCSSATVYDNNSYLYQARTTNAPSHEEKAPFAMTARLAVGVKGMSRITANLMFGTNNPNYSNVKNMTSGGSKMPMAVIKPSLFQVPITILEDQDVKQT